MRNLPSIFAPGSTEISSAEMSALIWALDLIITFIAATDSSRLPSIVTVFARVFPINLPVFVQRQPPWPVATTSLSGGSDWRTG